jgi:hypothetical protein
MSTNSLQTFSGRPIWRSIIALTVVSTYCYICILNNAVQELGAAAIIVINWYFQSQQQTNLLKQLNGGTK